MDWSSTSRVTPFGHLRITDLVHLPVAFRSFTRPSSPARAKASPVRPCKLFESIDNHLNLRLKGNQTKLSLSAHVVHGSCALKI